MSEINYLGINENFPVAGQDNDTQVFRDNFDTIKTSLRLAKEEITDLQDNTAGLQTSSIDNGCDFNGRVLSNAVLTENIERKYDTSGDPGASSEIDFQRGHYQIFRFQATTEEITADSATRSLEFTNFPTNSDGLLPYFGVGKVTLELYANTGGITSGVVLNFLTTDGAVVKKNSACPATISLTSSVNPVIIEVWRHSSGEIFVNYLGLFS